MKATRTLLLLCLISLCSTKALAYTALINGIYYDFQGNEAIVTNNGKWNTPSYYPTVTIPEKVEKEGKVYSVTTIGSRAFYGSNGLKSVQLPNSITKIGLAAFDQCEALTTVNIPEGVEEIGNFAFEGCSKLSSIAIPSSVETIGYSAYSGCSSLKSITVAPENSTYDSRDNCNAIIETSTNKLIAGCKITVLPPNITSIGEFAFSYRTGLTEISIPEGVTTFGENVFCGCTDLVVANLPNTTEMISFGLFQGCTRLNSIEIPASVTSIGHAAFYGCSSLSSVKVHSFTPLEIDEESFSNRANATLYVPYGSKASYEAANYWKEFKEIVEMPDIIDFVDTNVKAICVANWDTDGDGELSKEEAAAVTDLRLLFKEKCITSFDELRFFGNLTRLHDEEFFCCGDMKHITLPSSLSKIGERAFSSCCNLESIVVPDAVSVIENQTFEGCSKLVSITLPETLTRIGGGAFMDCKSIENITLPASLTTMTDAFDFCTNLKSIYIPKAVRYASTFRACSSLESIIVDAENPYLDSRNGCNAIIETANNRLIAGCCNTVIPEDIVAIGQMAFAGMTGLSEVAIPDAVYDIGFDAFQGTVWYNSQPDGLVYAGKVAYRVKGQVTNGTDIVLREGTKGIAEYAFEDDYCVGPASITIPKSVVHIAPYAFWQCREMTDLFLMHKEPLNIVTYISDTPERTILHVPFGSKESYTEHKAWGQFKEIVEMEPVYTEKCATPTIAYDHGELVFECETEGVTFTSEVTTSGAKTGEGERVSLATPAYTVTVVAKKEGYDDSDAATATIQWGGGRPVFTGFTNVTIDTKGYSDVNGDGTVDVADIATIISEMAARARPQAKAEK